MPRKLNEVVLEIKNLKGQEVPDALAMEVVDALARRVIVTALVCAGRSIESACTIAAEIVEAT